jgi:hypothetical protein
MNRNDSKTEQDREPIKATEEANRDKHNPFKDTGDKENKGNNSREEEAIAEQQRKETLTERD